MAFGDIILGDGVFAITTTSGASAKAVGLTRGGGQFTVEQDFRDIDADGDMGPVMGRVRLIKSVPKLTIRGLELLQTNLADLYAATTVDATNSTTFEPILPLTTAMYMYAVTWTGETLGGKDVTITVSNALNRENIDWGLIDKEEIVPEITYTGHYHSSTDRTVPWAITYSTV